MQKDLMHGQVKKSVWRRLVDIRFPERGFRASVSVIVVSLRGGEWQKDVFLAEFANPDDVSLAIPSLYLGALAIAEGVEIFYFQNMAAGQNRAAFDAADGGL